MPSKIRLRPRRRKIRVRSFAYPSRNGVLMFARRALVVAAAMLLAMSSRRRVARRGSWPIEPFPVAHAMNGLGHTESSFEPPNRGWGVNIAEQGDLLRGVVGSL